MTNPWLPVLAASLLQFLWQAAAVALVVVAAQPLLRQRTAAARYLINCLALFALPVLFAATLAHYALAGPDVAAAAVAPTLLHQFAPWLVALWIAGIALTGLYTAAGWTWAQLLRRATTAVPPTWTAEADRLASLLRVNVPVRLKLSARVAGPCTLGWLRPVILLPLSALTSLAPDQLRALLAHELAHIRRHDYLVNLVQRAVEVVFFFHPAVWWLSHQISEEREHCCDDLAVSVCGNASAYARTLLDLAAQQSGAAHLPTAALAAAGGSLSHRVTRLLGQPARTHAWRMVITLALVASSAFWLLGGSFNSTQTRKHLLLPQSGSNTLRSAPKVREAEAHKPITHPSLAAPHKSTPLPARAPAARGGRAARTAGDIGAENRGAERGEPPPENDAARTRPDRGSGAPGLAERQAGGVAQPRQAPRQSMPRTATAYVALTLGTFQACTSQPVWVPQLLPSGATVLHLQVMQRCIPVIRPVEVLVVSSL